MNNNDMKKLVSSLVNGAENLGHDAMVIRCNNSGKIAKDIIDECEQEHKTKVLFHEFSADLMTDAYEPFLEWVKQLYEESGALSPEEFLEKCHIYPLHRDMFCGYLKTGVCVRKESIIMSEIQYDKHKVMDSIINILQYCARDNKIILILSRIHFAGYSTIELLTNIEESEGLNLSLLCTYDDRYGVPAYMTEVWDNFIRSLEKRNLVMVNKEHENITSDSEDKYYLFKTENSHLYINKITNMIGTLCTEQALYYLSDIYQILKVEKTKIDRTQEITFYGLYATAFLYNCKYQSALMICDTIINMQDIGYKALFNCYYVMSMAQLNLGQLSSAQQFSANCLRIAKEHNDSDMIFISKTLEAVVSLRGGYSVVFERYGNSADFSEEFIKETLEHGWLNHLSYFYIYAFEQDKQLYTGERPDEKLKYFEKGIELIKKNENEKFLIDAYKKCAMFCSLVGNIDEVDKNYKKCISVLRSLNEKQEEADIYNGLGYNRIVCEEFEQANVFYNQALEIYYSESNPEMLSETFYNMSINALMADDYRNGDMFIDASIKLLDNAKVFKPRICNRSKLYGIAAYCNYKIGNGYKTQIYLERMERILRHILQPDDKPEFAMWDDELFFYYIVKGMIAENEESFGMALDYYDKADFHMRRSEGSMFVTYVKLAQDRAGLLDKMGNEEARQMEIKKCLAFCQKKQMPYSIEKLQSLLDKKRFKKPYFILDICTNINQALVMAQRLGVEKELELINKNMEFISNWQNQLSVEGLMEKEIVDKSMTTLKNNFGLDKVAFFSAQERTTSLRYCDDDVNLSDDARRDIIDFLKKRKTSFLLNRVDSKFEDYKDIVKYFGINKVVSLVCIPIFNDNELQAVFIAYQVMYENFSSVKVMLTESDLRVLRFSMRQLMNELYRAYANKKINEMNRELKDKNQLLEKLASTDSLTGLLNRQGFNKIVDERLDKSRKKNDMDTYFTVMYIDLDNFKYCNDSFGHDIGDLILKQFSSLFKNIIGNSGYVVRYGGDEFVIVVENINKYYGEEVAEAIFVELKEHNGFVDIISKYLETPVEVDTKNRLSCSIGIAVNESAKVKTIYELLKCADEALYDVKKSTKHDYKVWKRKE